MPSLPPPGDQATESGLERGHRLTVVGQRPEAPAPDAQERDESGAELVAARRQLAEDLVVRSRRYHGILSDELAQPHPEEPTADRAAEFERFFGLRTDCYVGYSAESSLLSAAPWHFIGPILEREIEERFPADLDLRARITAFRCATKKNQVRNIFIKRSLQLAAQALVFLPLVIAAVLPGLAPSGPMRSGLALVILVLLLALVQYLLKNTTDHLGTAIEQAGKAMCHLVHKRLDALAEHQLNAVNAITATQGAAKGDDAEWPKRCKWWTEYIIWVQARVYHIERFLQLELQRLRVFITWTDPIGNAVSALLTLAASLVAATTLVLFATPDSGIGPVWLWGAFAVSFALAIAIGWHSTRRRYSIDLGALPTAIGADLGNGFEKLKVGETLGNITLVAQESLREVARRGQYRDRPETPG